MGSTSPSKYNHILLRMTFASMTLASGDGTDVGVLVFGVPTLLGDFVGFEVGTSVGFLFPSLFLT